MNCIFCKIMNNEIPSKTIWENDYFKAILDINPVCDGHTLIIPKKHYEDIFALNSLHQNELFKAIQAVSNILIKALDLKGCSFSINYGDKQEVKHFHCHIMPDYHIKPKKNIDEIYQIIKGSINEKETQNEKIS